MGYALIIAGLALIGLLYLVDVLLPKIVIVDDIIRVLVAFFFIVGGVNMLVPAFGEFLYGLVRSGFSTAGAEDANLDTWTAVWIWAWAIIAGVGVIYRGKHSRRLAGMLLFIPLSIATFHYNGPEAISQWFGANTASPIVDFFVGMANKVASLGS